MTTPQKETPPSTGNRDGAEVADETTGTNNLAPPQVTTADACAPGELVQGVVNVASSAAGAALGKVTRGLPHQDANGPNFPHELIELGFALVPIPHGTKGPKIPDWQVTTFDAAKFRWPCNWGFHLGPSGLVDIDLDCPEALEFARQALPGTATYGRAGNPQSHWLYWSSAADSTPIKWHMPRLAAAKKKGAVLVELRCGPGHQTVAPGSRHASGEQVRWETSFDELAAAPADLHERVRAIALGAFLKRAGLIESSDLRGDAIAAGYLAEDVDLLIGGVADAVSTDATAAATTPTAPTKGLTELTAEEREMVVAVIASEYPEQGSRHEYRFAWRCVFARWAVGTDLALGIINEASERAGAEGRATLAQYSTDLEQLAAGRQKSGIPNLLEMLSSDAPFQAVAAILDTDKRRIARVAMSPQRLVEQLAKGAVDRPKNESTVFTSRGDNGEDLVHVQDTSFQGLASKFLEKHYPKGDLRKWRGGWYRWEGTHYEELDPEELEIQVGRFVSNVMLPGPAGKPARRMQDNAYNISMVTKALIRTPRQVHMNAKQEPDPKFRALANGVLDVRSGELLPHDPERLVFSAAAWSWAPETPTPEWDAFLASLELDEVTLQCLQEAMGYLVYGDDSFQKLVTLIGEKRSGKGTIAGVVARLVGKAATVVLSDYGRDFKLAGAIGADVMIDYDQRAIGQQSDQDVIAQRLLTVAAHEPVVIDRKYGKVWEGTLGKVLVCSNKVPTIKDSGGALSHRWVIVSGFHKSFLGKEDKTLGERLAGELPGIAAWVLDGWRRVHKRGDFIESTKAEETRELMKSAGSLAELFVAEMCETGPDREVARQPLYDAFSQWCQQQGERIPTMRTFGAELHAANIPGFNWTYKPRTKDGGTRGRVVQGISLAR